MNITRVRLKVSVSRLCAILAPHFDVSDDGTEEMSVETWDVTCAGVGVRIAEISIYKETDGKVGGGTSILRTDVLNGEPGAGFNARLFLACENWLLGDLFLRHGGDSMRDSGKMLRDEGEEQIDAVFAAKARAQERRAKKNKAG